MEELLMCSVCIERYHESKRHPVLLPRCGHSFCRPCVSMLISGGCVVCPTCRTDQRVDFVERLPTEYTLLAIISAQENNRKETCERHLVKLSFWCRSCEIATCGECLFEDHPTHSHDVIRATKYIQDMKENAQDVAIKFIEVLDEREQSYYKIIFNCARKISWAIRNIGALRKDMEEARGLMKGIKEDESISAATSLSEAAKFLGLKWNIQDANFHRKVKEEKVKDEIELEKERAQKEAASKEQEEKKTVAAKEKTKEKDAKRLLRKSKTLSSLEMSKELEKAANDNNLKEKEKVTPTIEKNTELQKASNYEKPDDIKQKEIVKSENTKQIESTKTEEMKHKESAKNEDVVHNETENSSTQEQKEIKQEDSSKQKELLKPDEKKLLKENLPPDLKSKELVKNGPNAIKEVKEEVSIKDIIKMKEQLRRTDIGSFEDLKAKSEKPKPKIPKLKQFPRKLTPPAGPAVEVKSHTRLLPVIQEKETEGTPQNQETPETPATPTTPVTLATPGTPEASLIPGTPGTLLLSSTPEREVKELESKSSTENDSKEVTDDEEDTDVETAEKGATASVTTTAAAAEEESINSDSGLSEDSKTKAKAKEIFEDNSHEEGKLMDFIQVPGFMICVEAADGRLSSLEWGPQGLHVHCLQFSHVTYDIVIRDTLLNSLIPSKSPTVFLELTADHTIVGRVYIKLWGHLRRAQNFLSLCLGDQGKSYLNTKFLQVYNISSPGERILGGDYESNNGRGGKGLLDDLEWNGDYAMPMKAGMITAAGTGTPGNNSLFLLCTQSDPSRNFSCPFGLVYEGLKVMKEAIQQTATKQVWITDCGIVIVPPRFDS